MNSDVRSLQEVLEQEVGDEQAKIIHDEIVALVERKIDAAIALKVEEWALQDSFNPIPAHKLPNVNPQQEK